MSVPLICILTCQYKKGVSSNNGTNWTFFLITKKKKATILSFRGNPVMSAPDDRRRGCRVVVVGGWEGNGVGQGLSMETFPYFVSGSTCGILSGAESL